MTLAARHARHCRDPHGSTYGFFDVHARPWGGQRVLPARAPSQSLRRTASHPRHGFQTVWFAAKRVVPSPPRIDMTHLKTFRDSPTNSPNATRRASSALPRRRGDVGRSLAAPPPPLAVAGPQPAAASGSTRFDCHTAGQVAKSAGRLSHACPPSVAAPCRPSHVVAAPRRSSTSGFTYHFLVVLTFVCPAHRARM